MIKKVFSWFESHVETYPKSAPLTPKKGLLPFIWSDTEGVCKQILILGTMTAGIGTTEALLFQFTGKVVNWLGKYMLATLFAEKDWALAVMTVMVLFSISWIFIASNMRLQTLQGVSPVRLCWSFHRLTLDQSLGFCQDELAGRAPTKMVQTVLALRGVVMTAADMVVYVLVCLITSGVILVAPDGWLLLPFIGWIAGSALAMRPLTPKLNRTATAQADARLLMTGRITDAYSNITTAKFSSHGVREAAYAKQSMEEFMVIVYVQVCLATFLHTCSFIVNTSLTLNTAALDIWLWYQEQVGVDVVAIAITMVLRANGLPQYVIWESTRLFENIGAISDDIGTLSKPYTILDKPRASPSKVARGEIKFEHVDFSYEAGKPLLNGFSFIIRLGEKVGLIGRSGMGKSTIISLLLCFHEPQSGTISIGGQSIGGVTQEGLRAQIGLVTQDTSLLYRSARDSTVCGRPDATEAEMISAADHAEALGFTPNLNDTKRRHGYDAHVGERDVRLSGGQRQRITTAHVMLKDVPILLFDEATSALDSEIEAAIQESLDKMMDGKTVIAITHHLSTTVAMDRFVVSGKGRIIEEDNHAELLEKHGLYAKLWAHQNGGFLSKHTEWHQDQDNIDHLKIP